MPCFITSWRSRNPRSSRRTSQPQRSHEPDAQPSRCTRRRASVLFPYGRHWPGASERGSFGGRVNTTGLQSIERELGLRVPAGYRRFQLERSSSKVDTTSVSDDSAIIIEKTFEYRCGFGGAPAWPMDVLWIGDEDDACPYALCCSTGEVMQSDHGNLGEKPLSRYVNFDSFVRVLEQGIREEAARIAGKRASPW